MIGNFDKVKAFVEKEDGYDKLAVALIDEFESEREISGRREVVSSLMYLFRKYLEKDYDMRIVDDVVVSLCGSSLESLVTAAKRVDLDEYL